MPVASTQCRDMTPQIKPTYYNLQTERDLLSLCIGSHNELLILHNGHRAYANGVGGSPIGAQVNFVHFHRVEPFLTSGGGFLYFNHRMFGTTQQFNFTAQLGGGVQLFTTSRRTALDLGYKYHHISNANLGNQNPGLDSH